MEKTIKIAVLETKYGGNLTFVNDLYSLMDPPSFDVRFFYLYGNRNQKNHLEQKGYPVTYLSTGNGMRSLYPCVLFRLIRELIKHRIDLLHCHTHKPTQYGAAAGFFLPKLKIISHVHGLRRSARFQRKLSNFLFSWRVNRFLTVADAVRKDLVDSNWCLSASKAKILENSVDYTKFAEVNVTRSQVRQTFSIPQDAFVFGTIGRLAPTKGLTYLLEAFSEVHLEFPKAYLLLVGQGPEEQRCRRHVRLLGIEDSVCFAGFQKEIENVLQAIDIFVISSVAEGMPRVLMEAMAAGVPCLGTRVGGIPEMMDESNGELVEPRNKDVLRDAMLRMIRKGQSDLQVLKTNAKERVRNRYDHGVVAEKLKTHYLEVLGRNRDEQRSHSGR